MKPSEINRDARKFYEKGEKNILFPRLILPIKISKIKKNRTACTARIRCYVKLGGYRLRIAGNGYTCICCLAGLPCGAISA